MDKSEDQVSEGLNQIFEIINAKGDEGELKEIVGKNRSVSNSENMNETAILTETDTVDNKEAT